MEIKVKGNFVWIVRSRKSNPDLSLDFLEL